MHYSRFIVFLSSNSTFPRAPCCRHSPKLLSHPQVVVGVSSFSKVNVWHCRVAPLCMYHYLHNLLKMFFHFAFSFNSDERHQFYLLDPTMPYATHGDQTLRATARDFAYYLLRDLRDPVDRFHDFGGGSIPTNRSYFSGRAAGSEIACVGSIPYRRESC